MSLKRYVIDGKTYELPDGKLEECDRLNDEFHEALRNVETPPVPAGCLSFKSNLPMLEVAREYRAKFRELLVEVEEQPTS